MLVKTLRIRKGAKLTIRAVAYPSERRGERDKCAVLTFLQEESKRNFEEFSKLSALLEQTAENGPPRNETKFKHLTATDGLYEFKTGGGLRLFCFFDEGNLIVCTHGFLKKKAKTPQSELTRAEAIKKEYDLAKKKGELIHV